MISMEVFLVEKHIGQKSAACYIRVSTEEQTEFSPDAQKKAIDKYAEENGYFIAPEHVFVDEGISGKNAKKRPAFMKMIARAIAFDKPFEAILVHKFDRFARNREDSVVYKSLLKKRNGVKVISISESIEDDKFSVILESILEAMAEYYSLNLSDEVKKGMAEKASRGELQSCPPLGYSVQNNVLVPVEDESRIVKKIFDLALAGHECSEIAQILNVVGAKTKRQNPFDARSVRYIIQNPVYTGKLRWNQSRSLGRNEDMIVADSTHEALIESGIWETVNIRIKKPGRKAPLTMDSHWLKGFIFCAHCDSPLVSAGPYWRCGGYSHGMCAYSQNISKKQMEEMVILSMRNDLCHMPPVSIQIGGKNCGHDNLKFKKQVLEQKLFRLRDAYLQGTESLEDYRAIKNELENELDRIEFALKENIEKDIVFHDIFSVFECDEFPNFKKRLAISLLIEKILWDKSANTLTLNYRIPPSLSSQNTIRRS